MGVSLVYLLVPFCLFPEDCLVLVGTSAPVWMSLSLVPSSPLCGEVGVLAVSDMGEVDVGFLHLRAKISCLSLQFAQLPHSGSGYPGPVTQASLIVVSCCFVCLGFCLACPSCLVLALCCP